MISDNYLSPPRCQDRHCVEMPKMPGQKMPGQDARTGTASRCQERCQALRQPDQREMPGQALRQPDQRCQGDAETGTASAGCQALRQTDLPGIGSPSRSRLARRTRARASQATARRQGGDSTASFSRRASPRGPAARPECATGALVELISRCSASSADVL
jgi:hypothetical protein